MEKLKPKAVIFDLGSTLIEYEAIPCDDLSPICVAAGRQFLIKEGRTVPDETSFITAFDRIRKGYRERAAASLEEWDVPQLAADLFGELGIEFDDRIVDGFFQAYYGPVSERLYAFDDTTSTLRKLSEHGTVIGLVSNTIFPEQTHRRELERFGIDQYFKFAVFSSTFRLRKPHPDIFYKAANLAGYAPSECLYVGDRYVEDVEGPIGVGMPAVLKVKPGREYPPDIPDTVLQIDTLSELFDHMEIGVD